MNVNLCFPVLSNYSGLTNAINSACLGSLKPTQISIMDNGGKFKENFGGISEIDGVKVNVVVPETNLGVAGSWNYFIENNEDVIIISNDDVIFHADTIQALVMAFQDNLNELFFCPTCYWEHEFSLFCLTKKALSTIGIFDTTFFPCYFEDQDYKYRMKLNGYKPFWVNNCTYTHDEGGSKTSRSSVSGESFAKMLEYYTQKWGGIPRQEKYLKPFNKE